MHAEKEENHAPRLPVMVRKVMGKVRHYRFLSANASLFTSHYAFRFLGSPRGADVEQREREREKLSDYEK